ncbi:MAG: hypothetical protein ACRDKH_06220 [Solirubrobacterales bacterium]
MGAIRGIGRLSGRLGRRLALRSRWLARRLWLVMVVDIALAGRRHWKRLEPAERERLVALARQSRGRPRRYLSARERREASDLLDKLGHVELAGSVAEIVLPFKPLSRTATRVIARRRGRDGGVGARDGG